MSIGVIRRRWLDRRYPAYMRYGNMASAAALLYLLGMLSSARGQEVDLLKAFAQQAIADLAARLSVEPAVVVIVETRAVTWPDSSLGCPVPGMKFRQIPVDGYRILLRVGGRDFSYHGDGRRGPFYCAEPIVPEPDAPRPPGGEPDV
jgi:hypothetical protein